MIGKIEGKIEEIDGNIGYIKTNSGVSYLCYLVPSLLKKLDEKVSVYTYLDVRDDALILFAFETQDQYRLYKELLAVDGVGPKMAFGIISFYKPEEIILAVENQDTIFFKSVPGVGQKTANRILLELSSRLGADFDIKRVAISKDDKTVIEALQTLGFKKQDTERVVSQLSKKLSLEEKIRTSIKQMNEG